MIELCLYIFRLKIYNFLVEFVGKDELSMINKNCRNILFAGSLLCSLTAPALSDDILSSKEKNIVSITSSTAKGDMRQLEQALNIALDGGLSVNEIKEILIQSYAYCGFPRSLNALNAFIKVLESRKLIGLSDNYGDEPKNIPDDVDKKDYGAKVQTELIGTPAVGEYIEFAPAIDTFLKEHLFADIFYRGVLSYQEREVATIAMLSSLPGVDAQLKGHINIGKNIGLTDNQIAAILSLTKASNILFGLGKDNVDFSKYFIGRSYLNSLTDEGVLISNVTFEPACRNNWHIHKKGGQILLVTGGRGYYQEWGKVPRELFPGDIVNIPAGVKHWHGAAKDSWFTHIAITVPVEGASTEWLEEVAEKDYNLLK